MMRWVEWELAGIRVADGKGRGAKIVAKHICGGFLWGQGRAVEVTDLGIWQQQYIQIVEGVLQRGPTRTTGGWQVLYHTLPVL